MAHNAEYDVLTDDLVTLGRTLPTLPSDDVTRVVMSRLADLPTPAPANPLQRSVRRATEAVARGRGRVVVLVTAVVLALLVASPVRAAILDWFGFAGVVVRHDPSPPTRSAAADPPPATGTLSLAEARQLVTFQPFVPAALGPPDGVEVSADRRLLSMSWQSGRDGAVRIDQFDGRLNYRFAKTAPGVHYTTVNGDFAIWFDEPHELVVLNPDGTSRSETARLAGHTLIWEQGGTSLRLEGDLTLDRAREVAQSVVAAR